jgi:hypothetical protein
MYQITVPVIPEDASPELRAHSIRQDALYGHALSNIALRNHASLVEVEEVLSSTPEFKESTTQRKRLALARLDLLTKAILPAAAKGNLPEINAYLKIQEREAKLTGMEAPGKMEGTLVIDIPWLTSERLAYKNTKGEVVENVTDITPIIEVKKAAAWKEPAPDGLAKTMRDFGEKG